VDVEAKQRELDELLERARTLEAELKSQQVAQGAWPPRDFYGAYYATTGFMLGSIGAAVSLLANVIGAPIAGKRPLELIQVFLTFPLGERALTLDAQANGGLIIALGCCLYLGTGMLLGVPLYLVMARVCGTSSVLAKRLAVGAVLGLAIWAIAFYGILSWLQPLLFGGRWITDPAILPPWVAAVTHVIFGMTLALVYPWGQFTPYRIPTWES
jgi:hypothetical protein